jgi:hypothetical protein
MAWVLVAVAIKGRLRHKVKELTQLLRWDAIDLNHQSDGGIQTAVNSKGSTILGMEDENIQSAMVVER